MTETNIVKYNCRICFVEDDITNMITPCNCIGSQQYIHKKCLEKCIKHFDNKCKVCLKVYEDNRCHEILKLLVENKAEISKENKKKESALSLAINKNKFKVTELLLKNTENISLNRFLIIAVKRNNVKIAKLLVKNSSKKTKIKAISLAINKNCFNMTELLLKNSENIILPDQSFFTAVKHNDVRLVKLLLEYNSVSQAKAKINEKNNDGNTPLIWAIGINIEMAKLLLENGADVNHKNNIGISSLSKVIESRNIKAIKLLLEYGADVNQQNEVGITPLFISIMYNQINIFHLLIEYKVDLNYTSNGITPLYWAIEKERIEITKFLIGNPEVDVNKKNKSGNTPLFCAIYKENIEVVKLLLEKNSVSQAKANVNQQYNKGMTLLSYAVARKNKEIVKLLLEYGADINRPDSDGSTPIVQLMKMDWTY